jgi:ATP-dependent Clp protease ATP-binding subunit ClpA
MSNGKLIDSIFEKVKSESEYGARPVLREVQLQLEDKLTDYIIDNEIEPGFVFKYDDIYKEEKDNNE